MLSMVISTTAAPPLRGQCSDAPETMSTNHSYLRRWRAGGVKRVARVVRATFHEHLEPPVQRAAVEQNAPAASKAAQADVGAKPHHAPVGAAAGVRFAQPHDVVHTVLDRRPGGHAPAPAGGATALLSAALISSRSRSATARAPSRGPASPSAYITARDALIRKPAGVPLSAARTLSATAPCCAPTPGTRIGRSGQR